MVPITDRRWAASSGYGIATPGSSRPDGPGVPIWVVDVNGQIVVVAPGTLPNFLNEGLAVGDAQQAIQPVIDSIVWKDLS
jgi:hypothetical protein